MATPRIYEVTQADLDALQAFAAAGNVIGYYDKLHALGDRYANLAKSIADLSSATGVLARQFAQNAASWKAGSEVKLAESKWHQLSIDLMKADLAKRVENAQSTGSAVGTWKELPWQRIRDYHETVYRSYSLPIEAWTPEIPFRQNLAQADALWDGLISSNYIDWIQSVAFIALDQVGSITGLNVSQALAIVNQGGPIYLAAILAMNIGSDLLSPGNDGADSVLWLRAMLADPIAYRNGDTTQAFWNGALIAGVRYAAVGSGPPSEPFVLAKANGGQILGGTQGSDILVGSSGPDILIGYGDGDRLLPQEGDDTVYGLGGDDLIVGDSGYDVIDGGDDYDTVSYKEFVPGNNKGVTVEDIFEQEVQGKKHTYIDIIKGENGEGRDFIIDVEKLILTDKPDKVKVTDDSLKIELTIDMGASDRQSGFLTNLDVLDLSEISQGITFNNGHINLGTGTTATLLSRKGISESLVVEGADKIILTSYDDVLLNAEPGAIVFTGDGRDDVRICDKVAIADLSAEDRITIGGIIEFHGGLRYMWSESPWAMSYGGLFKSGKNSDGELVVEVEGLGTMYILNWGESGGTGTPFDQRPGQISLFEFDVGVYRLLDPNKPSHMTQMGTWGLAGAIVKASFGVEIWAGVDPLTLDLDGDGIELVNASSASPRFDLDGDLYAERTAWVKADDGILVRDIDGNGTIDDVTEMFGGQVSGFEALAALDGNQDGKIDALDDGLADFNGDGIIDQDDTFATLRVWRDLNKDAKTDPGELFSLESLGIESISLDATPEEDLFVAGNQITATGTFTRSDGSTGTVADVQYHLNNRFTTYVGDPITVTTQAEALPDHKGFGTLVSLREAMSLDPGFATTVENTLPNLTSPSLAALRMQVLPILTGWALASPLGDGDRDPNTQATKLQPHNDVPILVVDGPFGRDQVIDYAYRTTATRHDQNGDPYLVSYWALASGASVENANGQVIDHPTLNEVLASPQAQGAWTALDGDLIGFMERFLGEELPLDRIMPEGEAPSNDAIGLLTQVLNTIDLTVVRVAVQGGALSHHFTSIAYDAETNGFHAAPGNDRQLIPVFESIFADARDNGRDSLWIGSWKPILDVVIGDFSRGETHLLNTYGFLTENIVAAYENTGLALPFVDIVASLGIPSDLIVTGSGVLTGSDDSDLFYAATASDDVLRGGLGPDTYIFGHAIGHDVIDDVEPAGGSVQVPDLLRFAHLRPEDLSATRDGIDLILTVSATGETITVLGQFTGRRPGLFGGNLLEDKGVGEIVFADGSVWGALDIAKAVSYPQPTSDTLTGTPSMDFLDGGAGDDHLSGGDDADSYSFGRGYGYDTIEDDQEFILVDGPDMVVFGQDITRDDLTFNRQGDSYDLIIRINGTDDVLTVLNQFKAAHTGPFGTRWFDRIEIFTFQDGDYLTWNDIIEYFNATAGTPGDDLIYGFDYHDVLDGGAGNDFISGGNGNDTYFFGTGYGFDVIHDQLDNILSGTIDTIVFQNDVAPEDVSFRRDGSTDDLLITLASGDVLRVKEQFDAVSTGPFGTIWFDRIEYFEFLSTEETLTYEDVIQRTLTEAKTSGDDEIYGFFREDVIDGGAGNDYLAGGSEGDTYIWGMGWGNDTIYDVSEGIPYGDDIDVVTFSSNVSPNDLHFARPVGTNDLVFTIEGTGETLTIIDHFLYYVIGLPPSEIEEFRFSDGTVWDPAEIRVTIAAQSTTSGDDTIYGFHTSDLLDGGAGNDVLYGGGGGDTYVFGHGYGHDRINAYIEYVTWNDPDTISFLPGVAPEDVVLTRSGDDLIISIGLDDQLVVERQFFGPGYWRVENFTFSNGTSWTWQDVQVALLAGTAGDDTILGYGWADRLDGKAGNDQLTGAGGGDTFVFGRGYGHDVVDAYSIGRIFDDEIDTVEFKDGIAPSDLALTRVGDDLVITIVDTSDQLTIRKQFEGRGYWQVEAFSFADGVTWTWQDVRLSLLEGTDGNDLISGYSTEDTLRGGAGDDQLAGNGGNDTYVYTRGDGNDTIIEDSKDGSADKLVLHGVDPSSVTFARSGIDLTLVIGESAPGAGDGGSILLKKELNDYFDQGVEQVVFDDGTVWTRSDLSTLWAAQTAANGDDTISGSNADDTIVGGVGNDMLSGAGGNDSYVYTRGDGNDTIVEHAFEGSADKLVLHGVDPSSVTFSQSGIDLTLVIAESAPGAGDGGSVLLKKELNGYGQGVEQVVFDDGTVWTRSDLITLSLAQAATDGDDTISGSNADDTIVGGVGNDTLSGADGNDSYVYTRGDGNDTIAEYANGGNADKLVLHGVDPSSVTFSQSGIDLTLVIAESAPGAGDGGSVLLKKELDGCYDQGVEQVVFDDGTVWTRSDLITLWFAQAATDGDDTISGSSADDTIVGGLGNDTLSGARGNDSYVYTRGDGNDTIVEHTFGGSADKLVLHGVDPSSVTFSRSGIDLTLVIAGSAPGASDGGSILLKKELDGCYDQGVEQVVFDDGTVWTRSHLMTLWLAQAATDGDDTISGSSAADTIAGGLGNDTLSGADGNDSYVYTRGDGNDTIVEHANGGRADKLVLHGVDPSSVTFARSGIDLTLVIAESAPGAGDGGSVLLKKELDHYFDKGVEQVVFDDGTVWTRFDLSTLWLAQAATDGDDTISGSSAADTIVGGLGNDTLSGADGNDSYVYTRGDGNDTIVEHTNGGNADKLVLHGVDPSSVTFARSGIDLTLVIAESTPGAGDGGSVLLKKELDHYFDKGVEQVVFDDGTVWTRFDLIALWLAQAATDGDDTISGSSAADTIAGGLGNDTLSGADGNDSYVYTRGDGNDTIVEHANGGSADKLVLHGVDPSSVTFLRIGIDLTLVIAESAPGAGEGGSVLLKKELDDHYDQGVEQVVFDDGTVWTRSDLSTLWLTQAARDGDDTISGSSADDTIVGGLGNDTLSGARGNDSYVYTRGDGNDTIVEHTNGGRADKLVLHGVDPSSVTFSRSGIDLTLVIAESAPGAGDGGSVLLKKELDDRYGQGVEQVVFDDGTVWTRSHLMTLWLAQAATDGDDTISGANTADTIAGGLGNDTLSGARGNDSYVYTRGDGNDTIVEHANGGRADKLVLHGVDPSSVTFSRSGIDLTLVIAESTPGAGDGGSVLLKKELDNYFDQGVEQIVFDDGTVWTRSHLMTLWLVQAATDGDDTISGANTADTIIGGLGDDTLSGARGNDSYVYTRGDGNDTIVEHANGGRADKLVLHGVDPSSVTFSRSGIDLTLVIAESTPGAGDGGSVLLKKELDNYFDQGVEQVVFDDGTVWTRSDLSALWLAQAATDGDDTISGANTADTIVGGLGDDTLSGARGNDSYVYTRGDGNDTIVEHANGGRADKLVLHGVDPSSVTFARSGIDLTLVIAESTPGAGDGGSVLLKKELDNYFDQGVEQVVFDDGTVWTRSHLMTLWLAQAATDGDDTISGFYTDDTIAGGLGDDVLDGGGGNDTIYGEGGDDNLQGFAGDDILEGGAGNDTLTGGAGKDTFVFRFGFGQDSITDFAAGSGAGDVIEFHDGLFADFAAVQAVSQQVGNDVQIDLDATTSVLLRDVNLASLNADDFRFF